MVRQIVTPRWIRISTNKQMTANAPSFFLLHHAPCNLLIFGLGVESPLGRSLPPPCALPPAAALIATGLVTRARRPERRHGYHAVDAPVAGGVPRSLPLRRRAPQSRCALRAVPLAPMPGLRRT